MLYAVLLAATLAPSPTEAVITNSGSTGTAGYRLRVAPGGWVSLEQGGLPRRRRVPQRVVDRFFRDLHAAGNLAALPDAHCMKSASFGTSTHIAYAGKTSPDVSCSSSSTRERALYADTQALANAAGVSIVPGPRTQPFSP